MRVTLSSTFLIFLFLIFSSNSYSQACVTGGQPSAPITRSSLNPLNNATLTGLRIDGGSGACISLSNCNYVTITNCILGPSGSYGIYLKNCSHITITNCSFASNYNGVYAENCTSIKVNNNQFTNVIGGYPRGQYVQFNTVTDTGNAVKDNVCDLVYGARDPQDLINMYKSGGTATSPLVISGNKMRNGSYNTSSGGILVGDNGGGYINILNNTLMNTGNFGIGVAGGNNINVLNNTVYMHGRAGISGIYAWGQKATCSLVDIEGNMVDHEPGTLGYDGQNDNCGTTGLSNNNFDASVGPGILPDRLLCPLLMAYYRFNANWNDVSGSGLNATATNAAFAGQGENLMCANFDGAARNVTLPSSRWLQAQSERFTVSCWIKPWTLTGVQGIAQAQNSDGWSSGWRMVLNDAAANMHLVTDAGTVDIYCGGITQGNWAHLVMVYDGKTLKGYVNGVLQASAAIEGNVRYLSPGTAARIGSCSGTNYLNAFLDEFKYYDGGLTDAEVLADYNANVSQVNNPQPELRLGYAFNNNWADYSGNGLTAATHSVGFVCNGEDSRSASFNGASYLTLPFNQLLDPFSSTLTVSCWIRPANLTGIKGIAQAQASDGYNNGWRILLLDGTLNGRVMGSNGPMEVYCGGIVANAWNHIVMTYDGLNAKLYVNGVFGASSPLVGGYIPYIVNSPPQMQIGLCNGSNYYYNGYMDEFRLYDGPMNATAIQQLYNTQYPLITATPNCPSSVEQGQVTAAATTLEGNAEAGIVVRPNPATDVVTVIAPTAGGVLRVTMYNGVGQAVRTAYDGSGKVELHVADQSAGVYVLRIDDGEKVTIRKVVIQRR